MWIPYTNEHFHPKLQRIILLKYYILQITGSSFYLFECLFQHFKILKGNHDLGHMSNQFTVEDYFHICLCYNWRLVIFLHKK